MIEASLKVDSFEKNYMYTDNMAKIRQIYNLILMPPGTDPLNPSKGCDVRSYYYQFKDDESIRILENNIRDQIRLYTTYIATNVSCKAMKNKFGKYILHVVVMLQNQSIVISTDGEQSALNLLER